MPVEVRPLGVKCNIACQYCYQDALRAAGGNARTYDLEAIKKSVLALGGPFTLFGGEPLLVDKADLEDLFAWGLERFGGSTIQTNAVLMDEEHLDLFRKYKVAVGISIDGPGELNDARWAGSEKRTAIATSRVEQMIERLVAAGMAPSIIATLHRFNATAARLPRLLDWFRALDRLGVRSARLHLLEVESVAVQGALALSPEENLRAMFTLAELERTELRRLRFDMFREIEDLLLARDEGVSCVWRACDAYTTASVQGVEGHGETSNCGRTNKAGVDFLKATRASYERYLALYETPQENNGCKGCRFFLVCKGQCPGTGIEGDWRNKTEHCEVWFRLIEHVEERLMRQGYVPISVDPNRRSLESAMLHEWTRGRNPSLAAVLQHMRRQAGPDGAPA